jgi:hypothetical protein
MHQMLDIRNARQGNVEESLQPDNQVGGLVTQTAADGVHSGDARLPPIVALEPHRGRLGSLCRRRYKVVSGFHQGSGRFTGQGINNLLIRGRRQRVAKDKKRRAPREGPATAAA